MICEIPNEQITAGVYDFGFLIDGKQYYLPVGDYQIYAGESSGNWTLISDQAGRDAIFTPGDADVVVKFERLTKLFEILNDI